MIREKLAKLEGKQITIRGKYCRRGKEARHLLFTNIRTEDGSEQLTDHLWIYCTPSKMKYYPRCEYELVGKVTKYFKRSGVQDYRLSFIRKLQLKIERI